MNPALRRRKLAAELRRLREDAGLHGVQVARSSRWSTSKISRLETGQVATSAKDVARLLKRSGADDELSGLLLELAGGEAKFARTVGMAPPGKIERRTRARPAPAARAHEGSASGLFRRARRGGAAPPLRKGGRQGDARPDESSRQALRPAEHHRPGASSGGAASDRHRQLHAVRLTLRACAGEHLRRSRLLREPPLLHAVEDEETVLRYSLVINESLKRRP
ncbi:XRE family transcriptional regulator [Nonomuraea diastatica]|uniref:XRE family transcriptional regulator n=1 Tax=Nonomuraea diastatica TaxID=1848329 RepID=A0A4R4WTY7_9ACTN|nr:XRE family transcriptional regulator [Nonomuraea diastatica]